MHSNIDSAKLEGDGNLLSSYVHHMIASSACGFLVIQLINFKNSITIRQSNQISIWLNKPKSETSDTKGDRYRGNMAKWLDVEQNAFQMISAIERASGKSATLQELYLFLNHEA